ncbi:chaperone protein [Bacillus phage vB_BcoS-136]|uniref:Chaperone protein n=1 Tax=Bacillus phage vB_BcoS-136 TaxID=2419619 RepID=A0A3G3BVL8_9CAUD|nr:chaperone protein [Bacillus phage vB_BcoS-136]AYP68309.1 chaperone protein [Bacillus phage vB_BcoS-136]
MISFFKFYYYKLKGSAKQYDIAMNPIQSSAVLMIPLVLMFIYIALSIVFNLPILFILFIFPTFFGNMYFVMKTREKGYELEREQRKLREEARRMERERLRREFEEKLRREREEFRRKFEEYERKRRERRQREQEREKQRYGALNKLIESYRILGLNQDATAKEVKSAYRRLAKKHHPDVGGNEKQFIKLKEAYDFIVENT